MPNWTFGPLHLPGFRVNVARLTILVRRCDLLTTSLRPKERVLELSGDIAVILGDEFHRVAAKKEAIVGDRETQGLAGFFVASVALLDFCSEGSTFGG